MNVLVGLYKRKRIHAIHPAGRCLIMRLSGRITSLATVIRILPERAPAVTASTSEKHVVCVKQYPGLLLGC